MRVLIFHGACLARNGRIILVLGQSGSGKSHVARSATGWTTVADDKVAVALREGARCAAWQHTGGGYVAVGKPAAVFFLARSSRRALKPLGQTRAAEDLLRLYLDAAVFARVEHSSMAECVPLVWEIAKVARCALVENDMRTPLWPVLENFLEHRACSSSERTCWAYSGASMDPSLRSGDLLVCETGEFPCCGSVVVFAGTRGLTVAHRLVNVHTSRDLATRGDNSLRNDRWRVRPDDILGVVTAVMRDGKVIPLRPANPELIRLRLIARKAWGKLERFLGLNPRRRAP